MTKVNFKSSLRYDGENLRISVPQSLAGARFEAYYAQGQLIVAQAKDGTPSIKPTKAGSPNAPSWYIQFGQKWVGKTMPKFRTKADIEMVNGQFVFKIPEQNNEKTILVKTQKAPKAVKAAKPAVDKRTRMRRASTVTAALNMLNKFVADNSYEWEVKDGKASLVKYDRIG